MMEKVEKIDEKVILVRINKAYREDMSRFELYEYTRGRWRIKKDHAEDADYAFSVYKGEVKEVYFIAGWFHCGEILSQIIEDNQEYHRPVSDYSPRIEFVGRIADANIRDKYLGKSVAHLYKRGEAGPIKYINC